MKDDVGPAPETIPAKRKALEAAPALWLAQWLSRDTTTPSQRRRIDAEKERRRKDIRILGFLDTNEGLTPEQRTAVEDFLIKFQPTVAFHVESYSPTMRRFHGLCLKHKIPVELMDERDVIKTADVLVVAPNSNRPDRTMGMGQSVWGSIDYASHRKVPIRIFGKDGKLINE